MRVPINLASQPRENLRPLRAAVMLAGLSAILLGGVILNREMGSRNEFRALIQQQSELEAALRTLEAEQKQLESALSTQEAQKVRERSAFMNSLILRKSLSWTQLFTDLEEKLPQRARITAIHPRLSKTEDVDLGLTVSASSMEPLVEFLRNLEASPEFGSPVVGTQRYLSERAADGGIELELTTRYIQDRSRNVPASWPGQPSENEEQMAAAGGTP